MYKKSAQQRVYVLVLGKTLTQLVESCLNLRKSCNFSCLLIHKLQISTHSSQSHYKAQREPVKYLTLSPHLKTAVSILVNHHLSIITRVTKPVLTMSPYETCGDDVLKNSNHMPNVTHWGVDLKLKQRLVRIHTTSNNLFQHCYC